MRRAAYQRDRTFIMKGPNESETADVVELLNDIEQRLVAAWVAGDSSFHEKTLADDWSVIDAAGRVMSKTRMLAEAFSIDGQITKGTIDQVDVRVFGDWAVVTGRTQAAGQNGGVDFDVTLRFTDVFACRDGTWQVVASQATLLNE